MQLYLVEDPWLIAGTLFAAAAAVTAIATFFYMLIQARTETWRRRAEIEPRPRDRWLWSPGPDGPSLAFYNVGGPAVDLLWIGVGGDQLWAAYATLPEHFAEYMRVGPTEIGPLPSGCAYRGTDAKTLWCFASDVDDAWWECVQRERIGRTIHRYLRDRLKRSALEEFDLRLFEVGRLGPAPGAREMVPPDLKLPWTTAIAEALRERVDAAIDRLRHLSG